MTMPRDRLDSYRAKRDFDSTPEPAGDAGAPAGAPRFVVQEHHASHLHWDLRLEHDGVLASWAIPRGIPPDPSENRMAVHTEDHPLEYLDFEGEIPPGSYGAGTMRTWDRGTFELHKWEPRKVEVSFHGQRLHGRYGLFSAGRDGDGRDWMIHRMDPPEDPARVPMPAHLAPMLARSAPAAEVPEPAECWAFEVKWDGVRALAYCQPGHLRLQSRNQNDITGSYPELRGLLAQLGMREAIFDGEIIAFGSGGRPSFEALQKRMHVASTAAVRRLAASTPVVYAIFDLLYLDGRLLLELPYAERRRRLEALGLEGPAWRVPGTHPGAGRELLEETRRQGLEGVVAKRLDSRYEPGRRSACWRKLKHTLRQELVIGGWLPGSGRRQERIGALLAGYHVAGARGLVFAGRVGTGFTERTLDELERRLAPLRRQRSPFRVGTRLPREACFVSPELVAEIEFAEWTADGMMRAPSFKGLRDDKDAREVVLEVRAVGAPEVPTPPPAPAASAPPASPAPAAPASPAPAAPAPPAPAAPAPPASAPPERAIGLDPERLFESVQRRPGGELSVTIDGRRLKLSNWEKVLFPDSGFTKGDLIAYYLLIAPAVLPHLRDRPLTLKRYPDGVRGEHFYEKQSPAHRPDWVQTVQIGEIRYTLAQDRATLVWLANLADIELHTSLSLAAAPQRPTMIAFDLDPGEPAGIVECCEVALVLRGLFEHLGLRCLAKTSGSKGMQVYVPLNSPVGYQQTKPFARRIAELLEARMPELVVSRMTRRLRTGRVLVDWSQNDRHKTTVTVYSVRARAQPTVSTPLRWEEVERCRLARDPDLLSFDTEAVLARVRDEGDLFAEVATLVQALPAGA
jgi:bifunctional non-homologous end joining protein LigD